MAIRNFKSTIDPTEHTSMKSKGLVLNRYKSISGAVKHNYVAQPAKAMPRILIVEKYRLSTYLGQYGAGRTVNTFTLLPGEKTTITINTYKKSETSKIEASSILDSYTEESAEEFENSVMDENSSKSNVEESFNYHAEAQAQASWGWGSASVSGGVSGGTTASREEFAKNVSSATSKNCAKASSKRDVQVNSTSESKTQQGEESSITREIKNINVGRTLNFVFRQMNQEFISVLHLVDVRIAFFNGYRGSREEFPLSKLDQLLAKYIVEAKRPEVKKIILDELKALRDYKDDLVTDFVEPFPSAQSPLYWRVNKRRVSSYKDETGNEIVIPGVILNVNKNVMRTDGVIVEALLGEASGLDSYSQGLQDEKVRAQRIDNDLKAAELERARAQKAILDAKDEAAAKIFQMLYPPVPSEKTPVVED